MEENTGRSRAYNRMMSWRKALRKRRIDVREFGKPMYDNLHQYSKNKIHTSIPEDKTDPNDIHTRKISERKHIEDMNSQMNEAESND